MNIDDEEIEEFLETVDKVHDTIIGLKEGTVTLEEADRLYEDIREPDMTTKKKKKPVPEIKKPSPEQQETVDKMVEEFEKRQKRRERWEKYRKDHPRPKVTNYLEWDLWEEEVDMEDYLGEDGICNPDSAQFRVMEADFKKRNAERAHRLELAEEYKAKGNEFFKKKDWLYALQQYTLAMGERKDIKTVWLNRALAYMKLGRWCDALKDLDTVIDLIEFIEPIHITNKIAHKAYFRRAEVRDVLQDVDGALADYTKALEGKPDSKLVLKRYQELEIRNNVLKEAMKVNAEIVVKEGEPMFEILEIVKRWKKQPIRISEIENVRNLLNDEKSRIVFGSKHGLKRLLRDVLCTVKMVTEPNAKKALKSKSDEEDTLSTTDEKDTLSTTELSEEALMLIHDAVLEHNNKLLFVKYGGLFLFGLFDLENPRAKTLVWQQGQENALGWLLRIASNVTSVLHVGEIITDEHASKLVKAFLHVLENFKLYGIHGLAAITFASNLLMRKMFVKALKDSGEGSRLLMSAMDLLSGQSSVLLSDTKLAIFDLLTNAFVDRGLRQQFLSCTDAKNRTQELTKELLVYSDPTFPEATDLFLKCLSSLSNLSAEPLAKTMFIEPKLLQNVAEYAGKSGDEVKRTSLIFLDSILSSGEVIMNKRLAKSIYELVLYAIEKDRTKKLKKNDQMFANAALKILCRFCNDKNVATGMLTPNVEMLAKFCITHLTNKDHLTAGNAAFLLSRVYSIAPRNSHFSSLFIQAVEPLMSCLRHKHKSVRKNGVICMAKLAMDEQVRPTVDQSGGLRAVLQLGNEVEI